MKRKLFFILILFCLLPVSGCVQKNCEDENVQSFFTGEIKETGEDYIICEVNESGNSGISEGAYGYVSRNNVVSSDGFPDFETGEYARIVYGGGVMETYPLRISTVYAVYKTDKTGKITND